MLMKTVLATAALLAALVAGPGVAQAHANEACSPLSTLVVRGMTCDEGAAIAAALGSHPYQPQFILRGALIECQTNYRSGNWVACYDGPAWASFEL
jgi:hypothetical protein